jgi:outer membrane receptor for ferrienterochelin and colicins
MPPRFATIACIMLSFGPGAFAHEDGQSHLDAPISQSGEQSPLVTAPDAAEVIPIQGTRLNRSRLKEQSAGKKEVWQGEQLQRYGAKSFADALGRVTGIDTQTFCANCGARRVTINGLRGEHTTLLVDDMPLHSTVSSFYGVDAVPMVGIEDIEVMRGAGSVGSTPDSIGGAINLHTMTPSENSLRLTTEQGNRGTQHTSFLGTAVTSGSSVMVAAEDGSRDPWDIDGNGVAESPYRRLQSGTVKLEHELSPGHDLSLRLSRSNLDVIGGNPDKKRFDTYTPIQAQPEDFVGNDVHGAYIGDLNASPTSSDWNAARLHGGTKLS